MSETVSAKDAGEKFQELLERVEGGEEVVIERSGKPVAKLVSVEKEKRDRTPGSLKGKIWISDDFNDPLPPEIQKYFE